MADTRSPNEQAQGREEQVPANNADRQNEQEEAKAPESSRQGESGHVEPSEQAAAQPSESGQAAPNKSGEAQVRAKAVAPPEPPRAEEQKRLCRSRANRIIGGVAGGIGNYLRIDPVIVRIAFILLALAQGLGIVLYIAALIIMPECSEAEEPGTASGSPQAQAAQGPSQAPSGGTGEAGLIIGIALVALGIWFLLANFNLIPSQFFFIWSRLSSAFWPLVLILTGVLILFVATRGGRGVTISTEGKHLYRSRHNRKIAGVAGGIADYLGIDATIIRLLWVLLALISGFWPALVAYIVMAIVIPEEPN
ncbi:MAG TPA: PspC domain-containing protein [Candidatus Aquicultor sp.]